MLDLNDTIVALATPRGGAVRGIVRLSGPQAWPLAGQSFRPELPVADDSFHPTAVTGLLSLPPIQIDLDATLYLSRAPRSYTGEDLVEVHTLGSPPILERLLATMLERGARQALPGEFTMRAFLNGKLDLTAAEAVLGLIDATSARQAEVALAQMAGGIAGPIGRLRDRLLDLLVELEAGLDFAEEDIEFIDRSTLRESLSGACNELRELENQMEGRSLSVDRRRVVLVGPPNAGKSSLFNALLGRDAAIVSATTGTTRDYLIAELSLPRGPIELVDTAGLDTVRDEISRQAQAARDRVARDAELLIWCSDASADSTMPPADLLDRSASTHVMLVHTKLDIARTDFAPPSAGPSGLLPAPPLTTHIPRLAVSARTGHGLAELRGAIDAWAAGADQTEMNVVASTAARCRRSIAGAFTATSRAMAAAESKSGDDLIALELRLALDELAHVVGAVYTDDILDRIFSRFCIGK